MQAFKNNQSGAVRPGMLLRLRGGTVTIEDLRQRIGDGPVGVPEILRAARAQGFRARSRSVGWDKLANLTLPCIAGLRDGDFLLLGKANEEKVLVVGANSPRPVLMMREEFEAVWDGRVILVEEGKAGLIPRFDKAVTMRARQALATTARWSADNTRTAVSGLATRSQALQQAIHHALHR